MREYTSELNRCMRGFFVQLASSPDVCSELYGELERCVQECAIRCVPGSVLSHSEVNETVTSMLRSKYKTEKVYCEEEGAFVFPNIDISDKIRCGDLYIMAIARCSTGFSGMLQDGDTSGGHRDMCTTYYEANRCQLEATADQCTMSTQDLLHFGLHLTYQLAHNPFCQGVPVSVWWPAV